MPTPLSQLLRLLLAGNISLGTYYRRSVEDHANIRFSKLFVQTVTGKDYLTTDPAESELFFKLTEITGTGTNSGFCHEEGLYYYESTGYWHSARGDEKD